MNIKIDDTANDVVDVLQKKWYSSRPRATEMVVSSKISAASQSLGQRWRATGYIPKINQFNKFSKKMFFMVHGPFPKSQTSNSDAI